MTPKKYNLKHRLNSHGNLDSKPTGWMTFSDAGVNRKSTHHRKALESGRIYVYEVLMGFDGDSRYGWRPVLDPILHRDQLPLFRRIVERSQAASHKVARVKARARAKLRKTPAYQQDMEDRKRRRREQIQEDQRLSGLCLEVGLPPDKAGRVLAKGLRDIREAHISWLDDAHEAVLDGERHGGIMKGYLAAARDWSVFASKQDYCDNFYHYLRLAIGAYRRHAYTNYDDLLQEGYTRDEALLLRSNHPVLSVEGAWDVSYQEAEDEARIQRKWRKRDAQRR